MTLVYVKVLIQVSLQSVDGLTMEDDEQPTPERCSVCGEALPLSGFHEHASDPAREDFETPAPRDRAFQVALLVFLIIGSIVLAHR